jgi:hypothetical protein
MKHHPFLTLTTVIAFCVTAGTPDVRAADDKPALTEPDKSVVLPANLKKEAEECFAKGYTYFVWPATPGPFRQGSFILMTIPFNYIAKGKPEKYLAITTVKARLPGGAVQTHEHCDFSDTSYSSAGKGEGIINNSTKTLSGKGTATIKLLSYDKLFGDEKVRKQISNEITVQIEM